MSASAVHAPPAAWPRSTTLRETVDGLEKLCGRCSTWWPADLSCFSSHTGRPGGISSVCKACNVAGEAVKRGELLPAYLSRPPAPALAAVPWLLTLPPSTPTERTAP